MFNRWSLMPAVAALIIFIQTTGTFAQPVNVEAAKKEGKIVVYGSVVPQAMEGLHQAFKKKYGMRAGSVTGAGSFIPPYTPPDENGQTDNATPFWMVGASGVELEVDTETGKVRLMRLVNVADVGTPINPRVVETQLSGAAIMQLGFSLFEKMLFDAEGQLRNASLAEYKIPGFLDVPEIIVNEAVVAEQRNGPFGGKGVGETATFGVSPAIANAIHDAVGVRLTELPMNPEAVFMAMQKK